LHLLTLTIGTRALHDGEPAGLPAATPAIIRPGARQKSIRAILAQTVLRFADVLAAIEANSGPKELVEALPCKITRSFQKKVGSFGSYRAHAGHYTDIKQN
jgi:hypothetical protein